MPGDIGLTSACLSVQAHVLQEEVTEKFRAVWQLSNKIRKQPTDAVSSELGQLGEVLFVASFSALQAHDCLAMHVPFIP